MQFHPLTKKLLIILYISKQGKACVFSQKIEFISVVMLFTFKCTPQSIEIMKSKFDRSVYFEYSISIRFEKTKPRKATIVYKT